MEYKETNNGTITGCNVCSDGNKTNSVTGNRQSGRENFSKEDLCKSESWEAVNHYNEMDCGLNWGSIQLEIFCSKAKIGLLCLNFIDLEQRFKQLCILPQSLC